VRRKRRSPALHEHPRRVRGAGSGGGGLAGYSWSAPPTDLVLAKLYPLDWRWYGGIYFHYGELVSLFPGAVLTALLAPRVAYRRRDALTLLFPPGGIRVAWIIGTRLGQLPHRDWPARTDGIELQGRQATRIAAAVNSYRLWRQRRAEQGAVALPTAQPCHEHAIRDSEQRSIAVTPGPSPTDDQY
jgi:hypothetical protein